MLERGIFWRKKHFRLVNVALRGGWTATYLACEASPESDTLTLSNAIWLSGIVQPTAFRRRLQIFFYNQTLDCIGALLCAEQSSSQSCKLRSDRRRRRRKPLFVQFSFSSVQLVLAPFVLAQHELAKLNKKLLHHLRFSKAAYQLNGLLGPVTVVTMQLLIILTLLLPPNHATQHIIHMSDKLWTIFAFCIVLIHC